MRREFSRKEKAVLKDAEGLCDGESIRLVGINLWLFGSDSRLTVAIAGISFGENDFLAFLVVHCLSLWLILHKIDLRFSCVTSTSTSSTCVKLMQLTIFFSAGVNRLVFFCILNNFCRA